MAKLYQIASEYRRIFSQIEENGGEVTDDMIADLNQIEHDLQTKVESCALMCRELSGDEAAIAAEIDRLGKMKRSVVSRRESLLAYMKRSMELANERKVVGERAVVSIQKNPPKVNLDAGYEDRLPAEYWAEEIVRTPNKTSLLATHKAGGVLPDCVSITQSERVVIK